MRIDLRQLATFAVVAETGSLATAAERLHLSPSALSMQLRALQDRLGLTLLRRTGRGLRLTDDGARLLAETRPALDAVQRLEATAQALSHAGRTATLPVSIGTILDPDFIRLGEFLRQVHGGPQALHTVLRHGTSGWVLREVRDGRLDFGFYLGDADPDTFHCQTLADVRYVVIAPRGWARRLQGEDSWAALAQHPWIGTPRDSVHHRLLEPVWAQARTRPYLVADVDQEASMLDLVKAGVGLSLAREALALRAAHEAGLTLVRHRTLDTKLSVVALRSRQTQPAEAALSSLFSAAIQVWERPQPLT